EQFKSLTTDNGSEFALLSQIEEQTSSVEVFFAHAFASWEKGTNERHNGLLREFVPKGHSLRNLRYQELQLYTDAINERPRRILDYATPTECLASEIDRIVAA
ncbi:IS30 family transposase, partial [Pisciglobus halotolerans]